MSRHHSKKNSFKARKKKDDYHSILMKASLAQREGRLAEAEKGYLKVLKKKPGWGQVLNALGTVYLDQSQTDKARKCFEKAANLKQPNLSACYNLARLMQRDNDHQGALSIYRRILDEQPEFGEAWNNAGIAYRETGEPDKAISCFQKAARFAPHMAEAWNNLGVAQDEAALFEDSSKSYRMALEIYPDYASAHFNLGSTLQKLKRFGEAEEHFKKVLEIKPDDEAALFMLQSLGAVSSIPEAAPVEHVRRIFDQCAGTFEKVLVQDLEYKTPELLFNLVYPHLTKELNVLDLGCGTGLGAQLYRPFAQRMTGVDISSKMLKKAAEKNIYDTLEVLDIFQQWSFPQKFDLICCSDVFVYFGNLERIIASISANLLHGGITAFSVERLEDNDINYRLHSGGRYLHSENYIRDCLNKHGLQIVEEAKADIRKQSGNTVEGLLIVADKTP
ncbi:MAG TPA: tetratricopeptide repeat protein [Desulfopila sp.]|nr:tetratricopeptide repeat protein [Desulfopila sp.]